MVGGGGGGGAGAAVVGGALATGAGDGATAPPPVTGIGDAAGVPTGTAAPLPDPAVTAPASGDGDDAVAPADVAPAVGSTIAAPAGGVAPGGSVTTTWRWTSRRTTTVDGGAPAPWSAFGVAGVSAPAASTATTPNIADVLTPPTRIFDVSAG